MALNWPRGFASAGARRRVSVVSARRWSSLRMLHGRHDATTFSHVWAPPLLRGTTWSMFSAAAPQYWQRCPSRRKMARRFSATRVR